jgi:hypothetical protein
MALIDHYTQYRPPLWRGDWKDYNSPSKLRCQQPMKKSRDSECVELDIGAGILWCKFCARSSCPVFKNEAKNKVLDQIKKYTRASNGRVLYDVFNPEQRGLYVMIALSHVGCVSFSYTDNSDNLTFNDPDFLEIP